MFEFTKKRRVTDEVKELLPQPVIEGLWDTLKQMKADKLVVSPVIAFVFSDDYTEDTIYVMGLQNSGAVAKEYDISYDGQKHFLGKGTIIVVKDKPKTMTMSISELNEQSKE
ncbi:hypothetical protein [Pediococcus cellicola]|uniref:Uncharacterized protein n=1 Tax=Pediococcus cellicola TaxID=319652 RepID=A0A0R2IQA0_9LACO|nr:hypothetical protein [Pediococcus cellicola]KRN67329.1 hypothetical protein IV80_GL000868 [Pediococcus cellicola]GEL14974.1 hypothetical protein PCE01_07760 [Pediococcus cellicola]